MGSSADDGRVGAAIDRYTDRCGPGGCRRVSAWQPDPHRRSRVGRGHPNPGLAPYAAQIPSQIAAVLTSVTGGTTASSAFSTVQSTDVPVYGGGYAPGATARAADAAGVQAVEDSLKAWVVAHYSGHAVAIASLVANILPLHFNTGSSSAADTLTGTQITFGLANPLGQGSVSKSLMQMTYFAINRQLPHPFGPPVEAGLSLVAQNVLTNPFITDTVTDPVAASLVALDGETIAATTLAITDATFQRITRTTSSPNCTDPSDADTLTFGASIAASYGLSAAQTTKLVNRFSPGTQYLNYEVGSFVQADVLAYLQSQVDATGVHSVDPFLLIACGISNPQKDATTVATL